MTTTLVKWRDGVVVLPIILTLWQVLNLFGSTAEVGRALMTPPDVPGGRLAVLRRAVAAMFADPAFKAEMNKRNLEFGPMSGDDLQKLIGQTLDVSPDVVERSIALTR